MNFGLWTVAVPPAWLVVRKCGIQVGNSPEIVASASIEAGTSDAKGAGMKEGVPMPLHMQTV
jgi:hypothetical protein